MHRRPARRVLVAAALACLVAACTLVQPHLVRPTLAVVGVDVLHAKPLEQQLRLRLRVDNPNSVALPVRRIVFSLELAGEAIGDGASEAPFTVPAHGTAEFAADVRMDLAALLMKIVPRLKRAEAVDYRIAGTVKSDLPFFGSLSFDQKGSLDLGHGGP
jgi:LEA14-like dessication related protein